MSKESAFDELMGRKKPEVVKPKGDRPAFKGDGVAVWVNVDKNGNKYLSIKLLGSINVAAFQNIEKS